MLPNDQHTLPTAFVSVCRSAAGQVDALALHAQQVQRHLKPNKITQTINAKEAIQESVSMVCECVYQQGQAEGLADAMAQ
jgi:hypothetical protein